MPCLKGGTETVQCSPYTENYKSVPKEIAILKTRSFGIFSLPSEKQLLQTNQSVEFRNLKTHFIRHLQSKAHYWGINFSEAMDNKTAIMKKEHEVVGLHVERAAYSAVKEGMGGGR